MLGARQTFFQDLLATTTDWHFETWAALMDFMMRGLEIGSYAVPKKLKASATPDHTPRRRRVAP